MKHLIVFAGPNGSGKSTIVDQFKQYYDLIGYTFINPDILAAKYFVDIKDEKQRYIKAFDFVDLYLEELIKHNEDIIIETVNSTNKYYKYYDLCKNNGYEITVVFVATNNPDINEQRVLKRVKQGGHSVPKDKIKDRFYKSLDNLFTLACISDVLYIFDNSLENTPRLCVYRDRQSGLKIPLELDWVRAYFIDKLKNIR